MSCEDRQTDRHPRFSMDRHEQRRCRAVCAERWAHPWLALSPPLHSIGEEIEVATLPLSQKRVPQLQHVAVHYTVLPQGVVCTHTQAGGLAQHSPPTAVFRATLFTLLVAELFVLCPLASLVLVRVRVDGLVDGLCHLLLPALRYDQGEVLVQLLVAV